MAVYEPVIQAVRGWVADALSLVDPANEVIPAAEGAEDADHRPSARPYYVVHLLSPGRRLAEPAVVYAGGESLVSVPMLGVVRVEAFGLDGYDGLLCLMAQTGLLYDPVTLTPITDVQRIAGLSTGEARIEARAYVDFDVQYLMTTIPGQGGSFTEGKIVDLEMTVDPDESTFDLVVDLDP